jgi:hypothetical protein
MAQTRITSQDIKDGTIVNADISGSAAIDATKIHDGTVSNTEFGYLNNVGSQVVGISDTNTLSNKTLTGTTNSVTATYLRNNDGTQVLVSGAPPSNGYLLTASSATEASWTAPTTALGTSNFVFNEIPSGTIDGSNAAFTLANASSPTGSIRVFKNGIRQTPNIGNDFVMTNSTTITFQAGNIPQVGDNLLVDYMK